MSLSATAPPAPLYIVLNVGSGHNDNASTRAAIEDVLVTAGRAFRIFRVDHASQLQALAAEAVNLARADGGMVVAAGGDGTINAVAQAVLGSGCPIGVLPQGTFNYFSRTHGIPADTRQATQLLLTGRAQSVQVGLVNERVFLVNASLGLYPQLIGDREAFTHQFGRSRLVAFGAGLMSLLRAHRRLHLQIEHQGRAHEVRTPMLFVGNNRLQMEQIGTARAFEQGRLAAIILRPVGTLGMLWLLLQGALSRLGDDENVESFGFNRLTVRPARFRRPRPMKIATDGEIAWLKFLPARAFVERLGVPITLAIPGNHDIPLFDVMARLFRPYVNYQRTFGQELEPAFDAERMLVVTVNTTRALRHTNGAVSPAQVERVARRLERAGDAQLHIVVTHQPVCVTRPQDRHNLLVGHAHAVRRWAEAGADLILGDHIHLPFLQPLHECVVDLPRRVWAMQAGTAVSTRVRHEAGNSVNLIRTSDGAAPRRCVVERWDYLDASSCFAPVSVDELSFDVATIPR